MSTNPRNVAYFIDNPIPCGFFLAFCEAQFNAENVHFAIEIDRFRDIFDADKSAWEEIDWREIDERIKINDFQLTPAVMASDDIYLGDPANDWPSRILDRDFVKQEIKKIWDTYLSNAAPSQICMSSIIYLNLKKRLANYHIYGKEIFSEVLIEPLKTMSRDILPRFLVSDHHAKMKERLSSIESLPLGTTLDLPPPQETKLLDLPVTEITHAKLQVELSIVLSDRLLYKAFLAYLRSIVSSENLLCVRAIHIFRQLFSEGDEAAATEMAWTIYKYFVAPNSAYEVSVSDKRRKAAMQALAKPLESTFDKVEGPVLSVLRGHYVTYLRSPNFSSLPHNIIELKNKTAGTLPPSASSSITESKSSKPSSSASSTNPTGFWFSSSKK